MIKSLINKLNIFKRIKRLENKIKSLEKTVERNDEQRTSSLNIVGNILNDTIKKNTDKLEAIEKCVEAGMKVESYVASRMKELSNRIKPLEEAKEVK